MVLKKLSKGMTVFDCRLNTGLNTFRGKWSTYQVYIIEINEADELVLASWNGNAQRWYTKHTWSKWRIKRPTNKIEH